MSSHCRPLDASDNEFSPTDQLGDEAIGYDSDSCSTYEEDVFDAEQADATGYETDLTDADDGDTEDAAALLGGNAHPPEYYIRELEAFDESAFDAQDYAPTSTLLLDRVEEQWNNYCTYIRRDPLACFESVSVKLLYMFFDWLLNQKQGKNGRQLRGTKKKSSLETYWKMFRLVYERAMTQKLDAKLNRQMHRALRRVAEKHGLSSEKREKRCMTIDDLKKQIDTTVSTTEKSFRIGECRMLCALYHQLLAPSGSRPKALLLLRFKHIRVSLARDPEGGPHKIAIRFTLKYTKGYLGSKDANTFPVPEVMWDPCLLLSPHVFFLGILFANEAFEASGLTSPEHLRVLDIHPEEQELPLPLKESLNKMFVFRKAVAMLAGYEMSEEGIPYSTMAPWIKRIGELTGFKFSTIPYNLRYNAASEFDKSGDISEGLRNLILQHSDSRVILRHYLQREIRADTMGIIRGLEPQRALVKNLCSLGASISKRRPTGLTRAQSASVNQDPHLRELVQLRDDLHARSYPSAKARQEYEKAAKEVTKERLRLRRALKTKIREEFDAQQAVQDIEGQLAGQGFQDMAGEAAAGDRLPQGDQKRLVEALRAPMDCKTIEELYDRRDAAINAVAAYCKVEENWHPRLPSAKKPPTTAALIKTHAKDPSEGSLLHNALLSVFEKKPYRCFLCVGKARSVREDDVQFARLVHEFHSPGDVTKHFRRAHLKNLRENEAIRCTACDLALVNEQHLKCHAINVHGTVPWPLIARQLP
ncbi:C2H2 finger domain protein [Chaetomidium leptoderma]|uniref:C2H2 finger domain protein n=1 Tax=Chaetomidium leptoderma TaxID=669021 RepID=A0AAN6ZQX3_9PEZI|nr:C2H2 finger domain protein [Chaetomidium leptoderma]